MGQKLIKWDGVHLPEELRSLPPGQYAIEPIDHPTPLTEQEEAGLLAALDELDAGSGTPLGDVVREIRAGLRRQ